MCAIIQSDIDDNDSINDPVSLYHVESEENVEYIEENMLMDSGAGKHMVHKLEYLTNYVKLHQPICIECANKIYMEATRTGSVRL